MNKEQMKELLKEMFRCGEIKVELDYETLAFFSKGVAQVIIDDEVVYESESLIFPTVI